MSEMHATAEPAYLDRLALHSNPFSRHNLPGAFFAGRQTSQRINLILHLLRSSSQISLINAPDGYGKSMLLSALQQRGSEDLRFCLLSATNNTNLAQIVQQCLKAFGATDDSLLGGDQQQLLRQRLQQLLQIQVTPVLLLDDADQLDNSVLQQLATWLHWQHEGQYLLRAVVTSKNVSVIQTLRNERFQDLDLLPLAEDEISGYLQQRLQAAGWQDDLPFNDKQLQHIKRRSKGIPADINHLAHQHLLGVNKSWNLPKLPVWPIPQWFRWLPVLPVVVALGLLLIFQQDINDWLNQSQESTDVVTDIPAAPEMPMVVVDEDTITSNTQAEKQNLIDLLDELAAEQATKSDDPVEGIGVESVSEPEQSLAEKAATTEKTVQAPAEVAGEKVTTVIPAFTPRAEMPDPKSVIAESPSSTSSKVNKLDSQISENTPSNIRDVDWIMRQAKTAYTFQLMGSWERSEIEAFIDKYALSGDVAIFASMRDNKVWHVLIYGVYDNRNAALKANEKWPTPLNGVSTWLRSFDGVQTQIKDKAPDA